MSTGQLLDRTFQSYRQNFILFAAISAVPHVCLLIGQLLLLAGAGYAGPKSRAGFAIGAALVAFAMAIVGVVASAVATAATTFAVSDIQLEKPTSVSACFGRVKGKIGKVVFTSIEFSLRVGLGFICFIIPGVYFAGKYGLAVPSVVLEDIKARQSFKRSAELTKDSVGRIIAIYFLTWILMVVIGMALGAGLSLMAPSLTKAAGTVAATAFQYLLSAIVNTLCTPIMAIALTLAYYDQRVRMEAFDIENMMSLLGEPGGAASANIATATS